jgi:hypothetical protein
LLPAGAIAGWGLHPLESAAFARRTPITVIGQHRIWCFWLKRVAQVNDDAAYRLARVPQPNSDFSPSVRVGWSRRAISHRGLG